jgi:hypothetical protein
MRNCKGSAEAFDAFLKSKILLGKEEFSSKQSTRVWEMFQPKFRTINALYYYAPFIERIIMKVFQVTIEENIQIIELRHIFGFMYEIKEDGERCLMST